MPGKGQGIFQKWFSNFTLAVFTQSLHAVMLAFLLTFLSALQGNPIKVLDENGNKIMETVKDENGNDIQQEKAAVPDILMSVITFFAVTGITRFEKVIKELFGIKDSDFLKGTKENSAKTMFAVKSAVNMGKNMTTAASAGIKGAKTMNRIKQSDEYKAGVQNGTIKKHRNGYLALATEPPKKDEDELLKGINYQNSALGLAKNYAANVNRTSSGSGANFGGGDADDSKPMTKYERLKYENELAKKEDREKAKRAEQQKLIDEYNSAKRDASKAIKDSIWNIGSTAAGLGFGAGMDNDLSDIINIGNMISDPIVKTSTEKLIEQQNKKIQKAAYDIAAKTAKDAGLNVGEAVMNVKINPQFVNDASLASMDAKGIKNTVNKIQNKVNGTKLNADVELEQNVRISTKTTVQNIKNTASHPLKSIGKAVKYASSGTNASRQYSIDNVDDI